MTIRVLVVDDEPDVEALFRQQFRREVREGLYLLDFALSGQAALDKLDGCIGQQIILLVSDINMPGMSGIDLIPEVKARRPGLPVFMISAYGDAEADSRGALTTFLGGTINGMEDRDASAVQPITGGLGR